MVINKCIAWYFLLWIQSIRWHLDKDLTMLVSCIELVVLSCIVILFTEKIYIYAKGCEYSINPPQTDEIHDIFYSIPRHRFTNKSQLENCSQKSNTAFIKGGMFLKNINVLSQRASRREGAGGGLCAFMGCGLTNFSPRLLGIAFRMCGSFGSLVAVLSNF